MVKPRKKYNPNNKFNPVVQGVKIDRLKKDLDRLSDVIEAISKSADNHISYLGNFARHDIKNAILSMDSILTVTQANEFDQEKIESLQMYLRVIRKTIDNFVKLVPYSPSGKFDLHTLFIAVELLTRSDMQKSSINLILEYDRKSELECGYPFQSILQMINNLVLNSQKALNGYTNKTIVISGFKEGDNLMIIISDNGKEIPVANNEKIFEYGFSTTGGSGIGLYHAKYLCESLKGEIKLLNTPKINMTKSFGIILPL
ncbi:MAG: HAMP domain-containing histidine kinase [Bacteroidales bacterium]|nr:HAMP domain-containing histidine kinase [Bacteroidales bacterium]